MACWIAAINSRSATCTADRRSHSPRPGRILIRLKLHLFQRHANARYICRVTHSHHRDPHLQQHTHWLPGLTVSFLDVVVVVVAVCSLWTPNLEAHAHVWSPMLQSRILHVVSSIPPSVCAAPFIHIGPVRVASSKIKVSFGFVYPLLQSLHRLSSIPPSPALNPCPYP
ncbi:hypothetical protein B0J13DRAFT_228622 [Dactylonectria estremocensis]|uniref:Uncharacterized protein n=1 Tax=Dactylonectria estremocensis TaxID=1079267 RepID=A0A9P9F910_9HYPO|nr:hypothetical protein B0J13DRAFT_228622 [Dactylonectria estremocensis]